MAVFIIKKSRSDELTRETDSVVIGGRSTCALALDDPLAAEEHAVVVATGGGAFAIEDLGTSSGTYVDGIATKGRHPLPAEGEVVIGVTRLKVTIDAEQDTLTLAVDKKPFHYDRKADPVAWSKTEVGFGRSEALRMGNIAAAVSIVLVVILCLVASRPRELVLNPGPLRHTALGGWHGALTHIGAEDCDACHEPFAGATAGKCIACHQDLVEARHPFQTDPDGWATECWRCHIEHRGAGEMALLDVPAESTCGWCHSDDDLKIEKHVEITVPEVEVSLAYETFKHSDHAGKTDCADCHRLGDPAPDAFGRVREFVTSTYADCMDCHDPEAASSKAEKRFTVRWHGAKPVDGRSRCLDCHADVHAAPLREVDVGRAKRTFAFASRSHRPQAADHGAGRACTECHKNGVELDGGRDLKQQPFSHGTHVSSTAPRGDEADRVNAQCLRCHAELAGSEDLVAAPHAPPYEDGGCSDCHRNMDGANMVPTRIIPELVREPVSRRNDFPHHLHRDTSLPGLERGCLACHEFTGDDPFETSVITPTAVKDCSACHTSHENVGGGDCATCHGKDDPVYLGRPKKVTRKSDADFRHMSIGHRELTRSGDCESCHGAETWNATSISTVPIPNEADTPMCRDCHIKKRFHWR